jgi:hypothetical protein
MPSAFGTVRCTNQCSPSVQSPCRQSASARSTSASLVRYVVWFVIDLESRRVHIAGLVRYPHDAWIQTIVRVSSRSFTLSFGWCRRSRARVAGTITAT